MEPESSLPSSQELSTYTYPEPDQSSPQHSIQSLKDPSWCKLSYYVSFFLVVSFTLAFLRITYTRSSSPHSCHMSSPPHPPRLYNSNYTWGRVQITKIIIMQVSPPSRHCIPQLNSVALSPQANYTEWATATCRRNFVPNFVDSVVLSAADSQRLLISVS
jgi:hypothetical protein